MEYLNTLLALSGVMALGVISPGPNFVIVTSTALRISRSAGLMAGLGLAAASLTWTFLAIAGLGIVISHSALVYETIKVSGAAYLIYIGLKMILGARKPMARHPASPDAGAWASMRGAYAVSMGNPKSIAFYGSIFSVLVPQHAPVWFYGTVLVLAPMISASWYCSLALMFSNGTVQEAFGRAKTVIETAMGLCLMVLGGRLLASQ